MDRKLWYSMSARMCMCVCVYFYTRQYFHYE